MKNRNDLFAKDSKGKIRRWSIWEDGDFLIIEHGEIDGEMQETSEAVPYGLVNRSPEEQRAMRIKSRVKKKLDAGYCRSEQEALQAKRTNALGYTRPMLAVALKSVAAVPYGDLFIQYKYDGHRCMVINDCGENIAYSKGGLKIHSIDEIISDLEIPEGAILDGELYHHGTELQTIASWVKRKQDNSLKLKFVIFDIVIDGPFEKRFEFLKTLQLNSRCEIASTGRLFGEFNILPLLSGALRDGYEGLMLRKPDSEYLDGQRSKKAIMKVKRNVDEKFVLDDEFLVVNIISSADHWGILVCETGKGKQFKVSAQGDIQEKRFILQQKQTFIGRHVKVEFFGYTKSKVPFHPVAVCWSENDA